MSAIPKEWKVVAHGNIYPRHNAPWVGIHVFVRDPESMLRVALADKVLVAGIAADYGAVSVWQTETETLYAEVSYCGAIVARGEWHRWEREAEAIAWLKQAIKYCESRRGRAPESVALKEGA